MAEGHAAGRPMLVELELRVKPYDVDFAGIVSNLVFVRWLEDLRLAVLDAYFPLEEALARGIAPILARTEIDYRHPLTLTDRPVGRMWVDGAKRARWIVAAEIVLGDLVCASARQTGYFVELATKRPVHLPEELRGRLG